MTDSIEILRDVIEEYADHASWRCGHDGYWEGGHCHCGLTLVLTKLGIDIGELERPAIGKRDG